MKLLTKEIENKFKRIGSQEGNGSGSIIVAKYFTPWTHWTWYATEYDPENRMFFGLVDGFEKEWGYFSLDELESVKGPFGMKIERDLYFHNKKINDVL